MIDSLIKKFKKAPENQEPTITFSQRNEYEMISPDSIFINEKECGNIYCLGDVNIDADGDINGDIFSKSCTVTGKVTGNILSAEYIEIKKTAIIEGNIKSVSIEIEPGSIINGFINIDKKITLESVKKIMDSEIAAKAKSSRKTVADVAPEDAQVIIPHADVLENTLPVSEAQISPVAEQPAPSPEITQKDSTSQEQNIQVVQKKVQGTATPPPSTDSWW